MTKEPSVLLLAALNYTRITDSAMKQLLKEHEDAVLELLRGLIVIADKNAWKLFRGINNRSIQTAVERMHENRKDGGTTIMTNDSRMLLEALNNPAVSDAKMKQLIREHEDGVLELLRDLVLIANQNAGNRTRG
jgi:hypothetical protein